MDLRIIIKTSVFFATIIAIVLLHASQLNAKSENQEDVVSGFHEAVLESMQRSG